MTTFYSLERLSQLYEGYQRVFTVAGRSLLLVQHDGQTQLLLNQCPHAGASLLGSSMSKGSIQCRIHGMSFDLTTGCSTGCLEVLKFLPLSYRDQYVGVTL